MNYEHYTDIRFSDDYELFLFDSVGRKGILKKAVLYLEFPDIPDMYNLSLVTVKLDNNGDEYIDGNEISDNGDRNKILATIANTAFIFIDRYPDKRIYFTGSNKVRTRLYQIAISHAYDELGKKFLIEGDLSESAGVYDLKPFERNVNYTGFVVSKK